MGAVHFSQQCTSGIGVGVAFDGTYLWYSCYAGTPDLLRADPKTGLVSYSTNITGGLGAIAYDATRNAIWGAPGGTFGKIWLITLNASQTVASAAVKFDAGGDAGFLDDGIAYDATDDTLYFKPDASNPINHYKTDGTKIGSFNGANSCIGMGTSGLALGGNLLFEGKDGCSHVYVVDKTTHAAQFDFSTQVAGDPNFRDEGLTCDNKTFAPVDVMWSKEAYAPMRASAFAIPAGTCGVGGQPPGSGTKMEATAQVEPVVFDANGLPVGPEAWFDMWDDGTTLTVDATSSNMDPAKKYTSYLYNGSGCTAGAKPLTPAQSFVGVWTVDASGHGHLTASKTGPSYASFSDFASVSIVLNGVVVSCGDHGPPQV